MSVPLVRIRVDVDNSHSKAEIARLQARADQCTRIRDELETLLDSGVSPFTLIPLPTLRRNEVRYRSELSDPFWQLLEREAV